MAVKAKTAEEMAQFLFGLFCRYGCDKIKVNEHGREFWNKVALN